MYTSIRHIKEKSSDKTIGRDIAEITMVRAVALLRCCIAQKLALIPESLSIKTSKPAISDQEGTEHDSFISQHAYLIKKYIGMGRSPIRASDLVRKKFLPRNKVAETPGGPIKAYPVSKAMSFWEALNRIGLTEAQRGGKSTSYNLVDFDEIPQSTHLLLNTVDITQLFFRSQIQRVQDHSSDSEQSTCSTNKRNGKQTHILPHSQVFSQTAQTLHTLNCTHLILGMLI